MKRLTHTSMSLSGGCSRRRALFAGCSAHAVHDGLTDVIYVLLPVWQSQFAMSYAWLGLLRGAYSGMMAVSQLSVGVLARRRGRACLLVTGTALVGIAWLLAGMAGGLTTLLLALLLGGLGASVQHPLASSLITDSYSAGGGVKEALAQYNFAGDIGKTLLPGLVGALLAVINWRESAVLLGLSGLATAGLLWWLIPSRPAHSDMPPLTTSPVTDKASGRWLYVLTVIGTLDSAARMGFLTFLPFLLKDKGAGITDTGLGLTLLFVGGALRKTADRLCGYTYRHGENGVADGVHHGGIDRHRSISALSGPDDDVATAGDHAERYIVGTLWLRTRPGRSKKNRTGICHLLHRNHRRRHAGTDTVRLYR